MLSIFAESSASSHVIYKEISKIGVIVSRNPCLRQAGVSSGARKVVFESSPKKGKAEGFDVLVEESPGYTCPEGFRVGFCPIPYKFLSLRQ
jgi:hypothetical protein